MNTKYKIEDKRITKYNLDYSFFEVDSPELWYFIGFFYADGYLERKGIWIHLAKKDKEFLRDLVSRFSNAPIHEYLNKKGNLSVMWIARRVRIVSILKDRFGLMERKTHKIIFPEVLEEYLKDFVRGYFDGDGGFNIHRRNGNKRYEFLEFGITCGSKDFINVLYGILQGWGCRVGFYKVKNERKWVIQGWKGSTQQFVKSVYYGGCLSMKRKADMYYDKDSIA